VVGVVVILVQAVEVVLVKLEEMEIKQQAVMDFSQALLAQLPITLAVVDVEMMVIMALPQVV
jgi:hypothetical protein